MSNIEYMLTELETIRYYLSLSDNELYENGLDRENLLSDLQHLKGEIENV
jgi:hypothetical protein